MVLEMIREDANLKFELDSSIMGGYKKYIVIRKKTGHTVGRIKYYCSTSEYCYFPEQGTFLNKKDMSTIMFNLAALNKER